MTDLLDISLGPHIYTYIILPNKANSTQELQFAFIKLNHMLLVSLCSNVYVCVYVYRCLCVCVYMNVYSLIYSIIPLLKDI